MVVTVTLFWCAAAALIYTQAGYPLLMALVARLPGRKQPGQFAHAELPHLSVLIPAHNEEAVLEDKLRNALHIDYPRDRLEILVASDGSSDQTVKIARGFQDRGVRVLVSAERRGKASTLNDLVGAATGDVLCLSDANVMFRPDAVWRLVDQLADPAVGAVSGDVRLINQQSNFGEGEKLYLRIERSLRQGESRIGSIIGVDGGMYAIRRELFRPLPPDTILDDLAIAMAVIRQGKRVIYSGDAVATESSAPNARHEFRRRVRVAAGAVQSWKRLDWPPITYPIEVWQYCSHKLLRWIGPLFLLILLISSIALWDEGLIYRTAMVVQAAFCALAVMATLLTPFGRTRLGGISLYFLMSQVAIGLGLIKGLLDQQEVTWER